MHNLFHTNPSYSYLIKGYDVTKCCALIGYHLNKRPLLLTTIPRNNSPKGGARWVKGENCFIMWSRCSSFDTERVFQPNHFVTMTDNFIQDKVKPKYSDIVSGRTIKCGKLERSTVKSFFSTKNQLANLQNSKAETKQTVTGQDKLPPTQWTRNSRGKRKENLEERNSGRLSNSFHL